MEAVVEAEGAEKLKGIAQQAAKGCYQSEPLQVPGEGVVIWVWDARSSQPAMLTSEPCSWAGLGPDHMPEAILSTGKFGW